LSNKGIHNIHNTTLSPPSTTSPKRNEVTMSIYQKDNPEIAEPRIKRSKAPMIALITLVILLLSINTGFMVLSGTLESELKTPEELTHIQTLKPHIDMAALRHPSPSSP